nr:ribonuclease H-like domain-containing protein [Tanacetum cinerariifolium]GEZ08344.1 ribonuclease H-like domain-containing protein [Tanacetum cinerariifolium]
MYNKYNALVKNGTLLLVPWPACVNMVRSMWLFKHKFHADGTLRHYKDRLVANVSSQDVRVDLDQTFSLVVKPAIDRTDLSLVASRKWPIHQLDVKNDFLNGDLSEIVYMHQPPGFVDNWYPHRVCLLHRSLYGLKQAPRVWFQRFAGYATRAGFYHTSCPALLQRIIGSLNNEFDMTDLGALNYFLGIFANRTPTGLFFVTEEVCSTAFERAHMVTCNPSRTPVVIESKLCQEVQQICLYMHDPRELHFAALKRILRYVRGTGFWDNLLSWSAKRQHIISRSSTEAEYRSVANFVAETAWVRNLLRELHSPLMTATLVYCDNVSAVYMSANPV